MNKKSISLLLCLKYISMYLMHFNSSQNVQKHFKTSQGVIITTPRQPRKKTMKLWLIFSSEIAVRKCSSKHFAIFTGKHHCWSPFLIKLQALRLLRHRCFPVNIAKFLRTVFFMEHLWWLLLFLPNLPYFLVAPKLYNYVRAT